MQKITCEQIYNIWISEPDLIRIVDLRGQEAYEKRHIPGAIRCQPESLPQVMVANRHRLLVFLGDSRPSESLSRLLAQHECVWMDPYEAWFDQKWTTEDAETEAMIQLETLPHPETGRNAWMLIDPVAQEVCCVDAHEAVLDLWQELQSRHYRLLFLMRTEGPATPVDFRLAEGTRARIGVPLAHATPETDVPLEQGQQIQFGDRIIRVFGREDAAGHQVLEFDFCGKYRVGGPRLSDSKEER